MDSYRLCRSYGTRCVAGKKGGFKSHRPLCFCAPRAVTRYSGSHRHIPICFSGFFSTDWELQLHFWELFWVCFLEEMEVVMEKECSALGGLFQAIINDMKVKMNIIYHLSEVYFFIWLFMFANMCVIMKILLLLLLLLIIYSFIFTIIKTFTIVKTVSIVVVVQNRRVWLITDER